jgi:hypothetical protein
MDIGAVRASVCASCCALPAEPGLISEVRGVEELGLLKA